MLLFLHADQQPFEVNHYAPSGTDKRRFDSPQPVRRICSSLFPFLTVLWLRCATARINSGFQNTLLHHRRSHVKMIPVILSELKCLTLGEVATVKFRPANVLKVSVTAPRVDWMQLSGGPAASRHPKSTSVVRSPAAIVPISFRVALPTWFACIYLQFI